MNRIPPLALAAAILVVLVGCAPNTDEAYKRCFSTLYAQLDVSGLTTEQVVDVQVKVADMCAGDAKADPAAFNAKWLG